MPSGARPVTTWILVATILFQTGGVEELTATRQFDRFEACEAYRDHMLVAYDEMVGREQALAAERCAIPHTASDYLTLFSSRCAEEEFRRAVPWIFLGHPQCGQVPTH
jgi:hypothetical protein